MAPQKDIITVYYCDMLRISIRSSIKYYNILKFFHRFQLKIMSQKSRDFVI